MTLRRSVPDLDERTRAALDAPRIKVDIIVDYGLRYRGGMRQHRLRGSGRLLHRHTRGKIDKIIRVSAEALIAAIVAEPDQEAPWLVYADWLLEREDVRGELIHFALDGTEGALRRMSLLEQDLEPLLSPRLFAQRSHWRFGWRRGFLCRASTSDLPFETEALAALWADPHAVLLEECASLA